MRFLEYMFRKKLKSRRAQPRSQGWESALTAEQRFRLFADYTHDWEYWISAEGAFEYVSPSCGRITAYPPEAFTADPEFYFGIIHPDDREMVREHHRDLELPSDEGHPPPEFRIIRKDGDVRWIHHVCRPVYDEKGVFLGRRGSNRDITDRKRVEEALKISEERFREAFEHAPVGMSINELDGRFVHINDAYCRMVGYSREELVGRMRFFDLNHPDDNESNALELHQLLSGELPAFFVERRYIRKDGKVIWVRTSVSLRRDESGNPEQIVGLIEDITRRREAEDQLRQARKMEALGRMAGGVAHEFNNMLSVIIGYIGLVRSRLAKDDPTDGYLREAESAAQRSADMTAKLLAYTRRQVTWPKEIDLNQAIERMKGLLSGLIGEKISIRFQPSKIPLCIFIDPSQFDQILTNLAINSRDAMEGGGTVVIRTGCIRVDAAEPIEDLPPGDYVRLTFTDTGSGMDADILERIFEPYFTTREVGKGSGLGLSTVYGIVRQNGGAIQVESEPGKGATFIVYFPCCNETSDETPVNRHTRI